MDLEEMIFEISGPVHMMVKSGDGSSQIKMEEIDWENQEHRRCVAACLVKGAYVLQSDRSKQRLEQDQLAPKWWESFHFRLHQVLECKCIHCKIPGARKCTYGAIFEYVLPDGATHHPELAPRYIVAFRGTMIWDPAICCDALVDMKIFANRQHDSSRFRDARAQVHKLLDSVVPSRSGGAAAVWLAGHSLGASIALDVGRDMMTRVDGPRWNLPTFLFNPPQVSLAPALNKLRMAEQAKSDLYVTGCVAKAALAKTVVRRSQEKRMTVLFAQLASWKPELYVHERDVICQGYVDYFEQRQKVLDGERSCRFLPEIVKVATKHSIRDMCVVALHGDDGDEQRVQPHLLPSATLWTNSSSDSDSHGLQQWWKRDCDLKLSEHNY